MCGIFGTVKAGPHHNRMLTIFNESRGRDSVGVLSDMRRMRSAKSPTRAIIDNILTHKIFCGEVFLGHTRSKTHGPATKRNAHPFRFGNIVGAHNGVISNFRELRNKYSDRPGVKDMEVDSEIIFWLLNEKGTSGLGELDGYAAIWWQHVNDRSKFYLWSWSNEYYICENNIGNDPVLAFSSVEDHLHLAGFVDPQKVEGDGTLLEIDTRTARIVGRSKVDGERRRVRGEWRFGDDDMFERTGVPRKYGVSAEANPTQPQHHMSQATLKFPSTGYETSQTKAEDGVGIDAASRDYFCHECEIICSSHDIEILDSQHRLLCPRCSAPVEYVEPLDAEWIWEVLGNGCFYDKEEEKDEAQAAASEVVPEGI